MKKSIVAIFMTVLLGFISSVNAQALVRNPTLLLFNSVDAVNVDRHEVEIIRSLDRVVIQSLTDNGPYTTQSIVMAINVMPVAFGQYVMRAKACAGTLCSDWSEDSNLWERVPGQPSKPDAQ